jgi:putative ABC transport system substrate-binding protein
VPLASGAQQGAVRRIGYIGNVPRTPVTVSFGEAFVAGSPLAAAREMVGIRVEVIVVGNTQTTLAAKEATRTVPIVMTVPADPVAVGLVAAWRDPAGM